MTATTKVAQATQQRPWAWPTPMEGADMDHDKRVALFWAKVDKGGPDDCWLWTAAKDRTNYGRFTAAVRKQVAAHRFAYELLAGPIPPRHDLDHLCRERSCVNPRHLEPVTRSVNIRRGYADRGDGRTFSDPNGSYDPRKTRPKKSAIERFWAKVRKDSDTGCWIWTAAKTTGYGSFGAYSDRNPVLAHRYAYEQFVGPIPDGLFLDHLCCTRACVNPSHLEPVTNTENVRRGVRARFNLDRCPSGHELTPENSYYRTERRIVPECRICRRDRHKAWRRGPGRERVLANEAKRAAKRRKGPRTHCFRDHEFTVENTIIKSSGSRSCRICSNAAERDRRRRIRAARIDPT